MSSPHTSAEEQPDYKSGRDSAGRFLKGIYPGGPGRPKGYKQKLAESFYSKMLRKFEESGEEIIQDALANGDTKQALEFLKLLSSMLPKQVELTDEEGSTVSLNAIIVPAKNDAPLDTNAQTS